VRYLLSGWRRVSRPKMKLFFAFSLLAAALVASSSATLCSAPAIPKNVTILEPTQSIVSGGHLPPPNPASKADRIVEIMLSLGRTTNWTVVNRIQLKGEILASQYYIHTAQELN